MEDKRQCSKCKVLRIVDDFKEGRKQCNVCLDNKRRYREKHKEELSNNNKEYHEKNREELNTKRNEKTECLICKCMVRKYTMNRHNQSMKRQTNLQNTQQKQTNTENKELLTHQEIIDNLNDTFPFQLLNE